MKRLEGSAHAHGLDHVVLTDDVERWLRRVARVLTLFVLAGSVFGMLDLGRPWTDEYAPWDETASLAALGVAALGLIVAWVWEPIGASVAMVAGVFVGALSAYQYDLLTALGGALLFIVPAALFLLAWHRTQSWLAIIAVGSAMVVALGLGGSIALAFYDEGHGPTHSESGRDPLVDSDVLWLWSGAVTESSAVVVAKVVPDGTVRLAYGPSPGFEDAEYASSSRRGPVHRFDLVGLEPATGYHYAVEVDGRIDSARTGHFATIASVPDRLVVAFASCARTGSNGAVFDTIAELRPDIYINTGDFYYGDVVENSLDAFAQLYDTTLTSPAQAHLYASTPIAYAWDDHDYGANDSASDSPSREAAMYAYRTHVPHYPFALPGPDAPIAQAFTLGGVRFIMPDLRSARDPRSLADGPSKSMLGGEQLDWFVDELTDALDRYPLVVWVNTVPWIAEAEPGADHWGGYAHERAVIASAIASTGRSERLIMVSGDAHMLAIDDGSNNDYAPGGGAAFPVIQAAALDRQGSRKGGPYSEGAYPGGGQFGLMTIDIEGDTVRIAARGLDWELREVVALDIVIGEDAP